MMQAGESPRSIANRMEVLGELCERALEIDPAQRAAFLREASIDEEMRMEAESLLAAAGYAEELFRQPPDLLAGVDGNGGEEPAGSSSGVGVGVGEQIGPYRLIEQLGEGGMGVVYRASQREPVRREVAVKIIKPGMDSRQVAARFGAERQALSLMDHPNIARVVDAGTTHSERAYFVMDLVRGQPITRYCDTARLTVRQRVKLMIPVCQAIQHAHQKGIIHRDIKPSNILVAEDQEGAIPKVIDFGIAKATETSLHEGGTFTRAFDVVGTFEYMSPEQAEPGGRGVDVRSDVYSLGAVLYELLTGATPLSGLSLRETGLSAILKRIQEETPLEPSHCVRHPRHSIKEIAEIAGKRSCDAPQLRAQLAGECDWIAMKALEKDRERRYESAAAMARDLERYIAGEAVEASPPSRTYRVRKFAARHRWAFGVAVAFVALLIVAVIWMSVALRQQLRANENSAALREVVRKVIIERPAQLAQLPNSLKLRSDLMSDVEGALDALSKEVGRDKTADLQLARAYYSLASVRGNRTSDGSMGDWESGLRYMERASEVSGGLIRQYPDDLEAQKMFLGARLGIVYICRLLERLDTAEKVAQQVMSHAQALPGWMHRKDLFAGYDIGTAAKEIAAMKTSQGRMEEALALNRIGLSALIAVQQTWPKEPKVKNNLAASYADTGLSEWRLHGYSDKASALLHRGLAVLDGCPEVMCRSRAAELEGYAGLVDWSGGREKEGLNLLERGIHDMESLLGADGANAVFDGAAHTLRESYAQALIDSRQPDLAFAAVRKFLKPGDFKAAPENLLLYGEIVEAKAGQESGERYFLAAREALDKEHKNGFEPQVMRWAASHALGDRADRLKMSTDALRHRREELRLADELHGGESMMKIFHSVSATAFARTVRATPTAPPELREEASRLVERCCDGMPYPYRVQHPGTIVSTPSPEDVATLKKALN